MGLRTQEIHLKAMCENQTPGLKSKNTQAWLTACGYSTGKNYIQPLTFLLNCPSKRNHYYNEIPQPGRVLVSAKRFPF